MDGFRAESDELTRRAGDFTEHAAAARRVAEELHRALEHTGRCWGDDEIGRRFAATHEPAATRVVETVDAMPGRLSGMGGKLAETARDYRRVDAAVAEELGTLDRSKAQE